MTQVQFCLYLCKFLLFCVLAKKFGELTGAGSKKEKAKKEPQPKKETPKKVLMCIHFVLSELDVVKKLHYLTSF